MLLLGRVECAFVQADYWLLAGARFDGQHIETARSGFDVSRAQKLPSHPREVASFFPVHGFFGCEGRWPRRRLRSSREFDNRARFYFYKRERLAVVPDHINFTLDSWRREIARDKNIAAAAEIPVGVSFSPDAGLARTMLSCVARRIGWGVWGERCTEALAGREVNYRENETR